MLSVWLGKLEVRFSFWFFAVVLLFVLLDHEVLVFYIALPILIHEAGHLVVMSLLRVRIRSVTFTPISLNICRESRRMLSLYKEFAVNLAGPVANLAAAMVCYQCFFQSMRMMFLVSANVVVALFNLLPIGDLDGGELCRIVCERLFSPHTARTISRAVSFLVLTPLVALSGFLLLAGSHNFTLLLTCAYLAFTVACRE